MNQELKTALISVYNKDGIVEFAKELVSLNFKILASGGTAKILTSAGVEVLDTADLVGEAILGHRVVTVSREIHAGLLSRDNEEDNQELTKLNIPRIDLVCVDLYPLAEEIAKWNQVTLTRPDQGRDTLSQGEREKMTTAIIEKTDIGGPTIIRSAAKGRRIVVCDPTDREKVIVWLKSGEQNREEFVSNLCAKAEFIVADYALTSARYHSKGEFDGFLGQQILECKYGENGWQTPAGLFESKLFIPDPLAVSQFKLVAGTAPSYNNLADVDRLLQTITHIGAGFDVNFSQQSIPGGEKNKVLRAIAVGGKHGNSCGAGISNNPKIAIEKMLEGDLRAIFGGVVMVNFSIDESLAEVLLSHRMENNQRRLLDGVVAPAFTKEAVDLLKRKGDKCRFLVNPALENLTKSSLDTNFRFRYVRGGFLKQPNYTYVLDLSQAEINGEISEPQKIDLVLAWAVGATSNSNTVTLVKDQMLIGNGVGQQDRVGGCELAVKRAKDSGHEPSGSCAYSDSFFPFVDGVAVLATAGIKTVFATSGSVRDEEIKKFCADSKIALLMLPDAQARGFFGH